MLLYQALCLANLPRLNTKVRRQFHTWLNPELCLTIGMLHMNVSASFLAREEIEPKSLGSKNRRDHRASLSQTVQRQIQA